MIETELSIPEFVSKWTEEKKVVWEGDRLLEVRDNTRELREKMAMASKVCLIVVGPSGSGKDKLIENLDPECFESVKTATTRPNDRTVEQEKDPYIRMTKEEMLILDDNGKGDFVEITDYVDFYYGTYRPEIERALATGKIPIFKVDWKGALILQERQLGGERVFKDMALVVLFICPTDCNRLAKNMIKRDVWGRVKEVSRNQAMTRVKKKMLQAEVDLGAMKEVAHFIAVNEFGDENLKELVMEVETLLLGTLPLTGKY